MLCTFPIRNSPFKLLNSYTDQTIILFHYKNHRGTNQKYLINNKRRQEATGMITRLKSSVKIVILF